MLGRVMLALLIPTLAAAQGSDDAARARAAVHRGEILRLSSILPQIEQQFGGLVLNTQLLHEGAAYTYAFDLLTRDGRLIQVLVNAATGEPAPALRGTRRYDGSDRGPRTAGRQGGGHDEDDDGDDDDGDDDRGGRGGGGDDEGGDDDDD